MQFEDLYSNPINDLAQDLFQILAYSAKEPKGHEKTFLLLTMIMQLAASAILSQKEQNQMLDNLSSIKESLSGGSLRMEQLYESLLHMLRKVQEENAKCKILCSVVELEHLATIHPQKEQSPLEGEVFEAKIAPLREALSKELSSIEATLLYKTIEEAKEGILSQDKKPDLAIDEITEQANRILRGGL
jgi:hypothetical protein